MSVTTDEVTNVVSLETEKQLRDTKRADYLKNIVVEAKYLHGLGLVPLPLVFSEKKAACKWSFKNVVGEDSAWAENHPGEKATQEDYAQVMLGQVIEKAGEGRTINLGAFMGNDYVDIDLDTPLARELAPGILPATGWMIVRPTAGRDPTHHVYRVTGEHRPGFRDFVPVEYRTGYKQLTAFPPSSHKEKGEGGKQSFLKWVTPIQDTKPGIADARSLYEDVTVLAICTYLCADGVLYYGIFHNTARCISGGFRKMGLPLEKALNAMTVIAGHTGQEVEKRLVQVRQTYDKPEGDPLDGWGSLEEYVGTEVVKEIFRVLKTPASDDFPDSSPSVADKELLAEMIEKCYLLTTESGSKVINTMVDWDNRKMSLGSFKDMYYGKAGTMLVDVPGKNEPELKLKPIVNAWLADDNRITVVGETYLPGEPMLIDCDGGKLFNEFHIPPRKVNRGVDKIGIFFEHMEFLFPEPENRELMLDFFGFCIQHPERRVKWAPMLISKHQRVGKGFLFNMMTALLGMPNVSTPPIGQVVDPDIRFNEYLHNIQFCCIDEAKEGSRNGKFQMSDKLKHIITEDVQRVEKKGKTAMSCRVYAKMMFLSNHADAIAIDAEDKRMWVYTIAQEKRSPEYYMALFGILEDETALDQLWTWFADRDLAFFDANDAPHVTAAKREMIKQNQCIEEQIVRIISEEGVEGFEIVTFEQLRQLARVYNEAGVDIRRSVFRRFVSEILPRVSHVDAPSRGCVKWGGSQQTVWVVGNKEHWESLELDEGNRQIIRDIFDTNKTKICAMDFDD